MVVWFVFGAMCALVILLGLAYLKFASLNNEVKKAWQQLDHQLKFRTELIPSVALSAAAFSELEREFIYQMSALKNPLPPHPALAARVAYEAQVTQAFRRVLEVARQHPELQTDEHFTKLKLSVAQAEKHIQQAKKKYNSTAHTFNIVTSVIPLNWLANLCEMPPYDYFDFEVSSPL